MRSGRCTATEPCPLGYRSWLVQDGVLMSPFRKTLWMRPFLRAKNWTNEGALRGAGGIHASLSVEDGDFAIAQAYGIVRVAPGADYVLGEKGWRAEAVEILRLYVASRCLIEPLARRYGVSVKLLPGVHPTALIDPEAVVDPTARIGKFARIGRRAVVGRSATIGGAARIGKFANVDYKVLIGDRVIVGNRAQIYREVIVGNGARIGRRAIILPRSFIGENVRIEDDAFVENGSVVLNDGLLCGEMSIVRDRKEVISKQAQAIRNITSASGRS